MLTDFSDFRVITPECISKSMSELRVTTRTLGFTMVTAAELGYPDRVNLLASPDGTQLVLTANYDFDEGSIPFCPPEMDRNKKMISIRAPQFVKYIRQQFEWDDKRPRKIYGAYFAQEGFIVFDFRKACFTNQKRKNTALVSLNDYPRFRDIKRTFRPCIGALPAASVIAL